MILNTVKFNKAVKARGLALEDLAPAIERPGLVAASALHNWSRGNFKPRPGREDLTKLASALGVDVKEIVRFEASHRWARTSPRKARLIVDLIRGKDIDTALNLLRFNKRRAAVYVRKTLDSAITAAEDAEADLTNLVVSESRVDGGMVIKRFRPKDRGRAHPIHKPTSHIVVAVEERT